MANWLVPLSSAEKLTLRSSTIHYDVISLYRTHCNRFPLETINARLHSIPIPIRRWLAWHIARNRCDTIIISILSQKDWHENLRLVDVNIKASRLSVGCRFHVHMQIKRKILFTNPIGFGVIFSCSFSQLSNDIDIDKIQCGRAQDRNRCDCMSVITSHSIYRDDHINPSNLFWSKLFAKIPFGWMWSCGRRVSSSDAATATQIYSKHKSPAQCLSQ